MQNKMRKKRLFLCILVGVCILLMSACTDEKKEVSAEDLYEKAAVSVVEVKGQYEGGTSTGSGFFYNERGTVVTNYHVIEKCTSADIVLNTGESYSVKSVLGYSKEKDIAQVCSAFGGGGHKLAAGAVIKANPKKAVSMILEEIKKRLYD